LQHPYSALNFQGISKAEPDTCNTAMDALKSYLGSVMQEIVHRQSEEDKEVTLSDMLFATARGIR
jgi:hypothetical protein